MANAGTGHLLWGTTSCQTQEAPGSCQNQYDCISLLLYNGDDSHLTPVPSAKDRIPESRPLPRATAPSRTPHLLQHRGKLRTKTKHKGSQTLKASGDSSEDGWWFDLSAGALITGVLPSAARTKRERAASKGRTITRGAKSRPCSPHRVLKSKVTSFKGATPC
ncbi:uncharacterized protein LOC113070240 isoform X1 [Carassius auratus]|uniref:Uncharacterized protein LOC113070240 isoform X1 n=1 Tax=Carassius auratus TaxID=7957 RepID=A0A6P6MRD5_CARAU|nr:uncharacterized protein LOC113070240 isoform X1 [Carassius auratus]